MKYFVTGIGTEVGKTIASAVIVEALQADYWKPIQAGDLDFSDTHKTQSLVSNENTGFFEESYRLKHAMSPHAAAQRDGVEIKIDQSIAYGELINRSPLAKSDTALSQLIETSANRSSKLNIIVFDDLV